MMGESGCGKSTLLNVLLVLCVRVVWCPRARRSPCVPDRYVTGLGTTLAGSRGSLTTAPTVPKWLSLQGA